MYDIYDTLFREEADGSYVPNLCTEYSFNEDGTELTMKLVEGVKFQNGDVMTVDDVVFSLNTSIASSFTTKFTSSMKEAVKVDDNTVKLVLKYAYAPVIGSLVNATTSIVPKRVYEADPEGFAQNPVGSGPYMLKEVVKGEKYVFEAFPDYFRGEASIKNMICRVIPDNNAALMALESGELDVMQPNQDYSDRQAIEDNPNLEYYTAPQACTFLIAFNNAKGIFSDKRMREAVAIAQLIKKKLRLEQPMVMRPRQKLELLRFVHRHPRISRGWKGMWSVQNSWLPKQDIQMGLTSLCELSEQATIPNRQRLYRPN